MIPFCESNGPGEPIPIALTSSRLTSPSFITD